jgi:uncharacterized protein (TIGR02147 family)
MKNGLSKSREKTKSIFMYEDYRSFLRDHYAYKKNVDSKFSFRFFSKSAGFKSTNILKLVMQGQRNIGSRGIEKFVKGLKLNKAEAQYFQALVLFNQATSSEEKQHYAESLVRARSSLKVFSLEGSQFNYLSRWYYVPIRELVSLPGFKENCNWIAQQVSPPITPQEARAALEELEKMKLIKRDKSGRLVQDKSHLETPNALVLSSLANTHKKLIQLGAESIDRVNRENREIIGISFSMPLSLIPQIKEMVQEFRNNILSACEGAEADSVFQLNVQLFPIAGPVAPPQSEKE